MYAAGGRDSSGQFQDAYESQQNLSAYHAQPHQDWHNFRDANQSYGSATSENPVYGASEEKAAQHGRSDFSLATNQVDQDPRDYAQPIPRDDKLPRASFGPGGKPDRASVAAHMAASGEIPKKAGLRMWRKEAHKGSFTRGGRGKCFGRCCCCTFVTAILIVIGIIAGFLLWVRPPNVEFYGIDDPSVTMPDNGFSIDVKINIGVQNPNFFGASFEKIDATAFYPGVSHDTELGGGELKNLNIGANTNNTIHFPFTVNYTTDIDPNGDILEDIFNKCKGDNGQLTIDYDLKVKLKLVAITISPTISSSTTFDCPLPSDQLQGLLNGVSGGGSRRRDVSSTDAGSADSQPLPSLSGRASALERKSPETDDSRRLGS